MRVRGIGVGVMLAVGVAVGCSASGSSDGVEGEATPTEPAVVQAPTTLPPASSAPATVDAGKATPKDAGKDSTVDAGSPPPVAGTACTVLDEVKKKTCGACGEQLTVCLGSGSDAGGGTWSEYGPCAGEVVGGCLPGFDRGEGVGRRQQRGGHAPGRSRHTHHCAAVTRLHVVDTDAVLPDPGCGRSVRDVWRTKRHD